MEQGKGSTTRELEDLEKRIYLLVTQFIEQKASMQTVPRVQANGKPGIKRTRNLESVIDDQVNMETPIDSSRRSGATFLSQSPRVQGLPGVIAKLTQTPQQTSKQYLESYSGSKVMPMSTSVGQRLNSAATHTSISRAHSRYNRSIGEIRGLKDSQPQFYATSYKQKFFDPKDQDLISNSDARLEQLKKLQASSNQTSLWFTDFSYQQAPAPLPTKD